MKVDFITKTAGYTGHVPYRYDLVGVTNGYANKVCQAHVEMTNSNLLTSSFVRSKSPSNVNQSNYETRNNNDYKI
jgi:hypothetical protein